MQVSEDIRFYRFLHHFVAMPKMFSMINSIEQTIKAVYTLYELLLKTFSQSIAQLEIQRNQALLDSSERQQCCSVRIEFDIIDIKPQIPRPLAEVMVSYREPTNSGLNGLLRNYPTVSTARVANGHSSMRLGTRGHCPRSSGPLH
jgi:hypothetical protein